TDLFLNMQYRVTEKGLERFAATEQVLDGFTHMGNRYPARHEPWESVESMAIWLWKRGIKDVFAFDVGVVATDRGTRYIPIECNPRFNGATYPTGIAEEFEIPGWTAVQLNTRWRSLADLDLSGIEFNPRIKKGIILVNWGPILAGKIGVLIAGNPTEQDILRIELERRL
ncbi:MAG: ATP-grasp domain-containing protein, partial [Pseudomonadota bacterium]